MHIVHNAYKHKLLCILPLQVLREYGGIYLDNDCLVVNDITNLRRHHCVVAKPADEDFIGKHRFLFDISIFTWLCLSCNID